MILVVGGLGSGKRHFITKTLGYSERDFAREPTDDKPVLLDLHEYIRETGHVEATLLETLLAKQVISCNEVGCGVVPLAAEERRWRDEVGRACVELAAQADVVVRMVCGMPQVIKGRLP